jgi:hypothetical protein
MARRGGSDGLRAPLRCSDAALLVGHIATDNLPPRALPRAAHRRARLVICRRGEPLSIASGSGRSSFTPLLAGCPGRRRVGCSRTLTTGRRSVRAASRGDSATGRSGALTASAPGASGRGRDRDRDDGRGSAAPGRMDVARAPDARREGPLITRRPAGLPHAIRVGPAPSSPSRAPRGADEAGNPADQLVSPRNGRFPGHR